ncbi:type VII secretion protein EccCa [Streptomyces monticola]|uniref:Type VII secretion protein EccCa n=1 Tax=Streptomyces monticola TaxID=2666263 RepID=A0ABW2JGF1_9ACTN
MSQIVVKRPPRAALPDVPAHELVLQSPPELPRGQQEGVLLQLLPMLGMGSSVVFFFMPNLHPFMRIMGVLMAVSTVAMVIAQFIRYRRGAQGEMADVRRDYLKYLAQLRRSVRKTERVQRNVQLYVHPDPDQLWSIVAEGTRIWERRVSDSDFGQARIGLGPQQLATPLIAPETAPIDELEPLSAGAMQQFLAVHGAVDNLPVALSMRAFYHVTISGDGPSAQSTARALIAQLVTLHSPEDLMVAVVADPPAVERWDWTKWLPHTQLPGQLDGTGTKRLFGDDLEELEQLLQDRLDGRPRFSREGQPLYDLPHIVVVLDGGRMPPGSLLATPEGLQGVTIVEVVDGDLDPEEPRGGLSVVVHPGRLRLESGHDIVYEGIPDGLSTTEADVLARRLAPLRIGGDDDEPLLANLDFTDLLNLGDAATVDVTTTWRPRSTAERLRVPIGVGEDGEPVMLDLKEAAQDGMGPHGLCVGATGSGKSELLRTLVLGLAVTHSSETLNFVLADFKGGATFAGMAKLPHVSAVITNLSDDLTLVDRMGDAIRGELQRRQELLRSAGNFANIHDYEKARAAGHALEPLASLVLVIDEFSELLTAKPDFIEMFIQIGRIGRSLGVHLLLASQRLEEGKLRGLDTYLSYRIGLRTFSAAESRTALGVPDAYHLPSVPGSGYLKFATDEMIRFKAAYVSGNYRTGGPSVAEGQLPVERRSALFSATPVPAVYAPHDPRTGAMHPGADVDVLADTVLDVIVRRLDGQGPPAHQVWLPPLDRSATLAQLLPPLAPRADRGYTTNDPLVTGRLAVPLGLIDKPFEQRRETLRQDFSGAAGHMLIIGGPQSGKSTLLRTLISSFALTHSPHEVQFYGLDFGGGGMVALADLPHVGGIASRLDPERVRRTVAEVAGVLNRREEYFRAHNIDSITTYRRKRAAGELPGEAWGDVFLLIDGWGAFKSEYEHLEGVVADLASRGLGYGIHVVLTASRYMEVRAAVKDQLLGRLELRLGDTMDSEFNRKVAANVPIGMPGRGQVPEHLQFMAAVPCIEQNDEDEDLSQSTARLVQTVREHWHGPAAPRVRLLPRKVPADQLPKASETQAQGIAIGIDETNLEPVYIDFETDPFFLIFGESESGKTAALRHITQKIAERYTPDEAKIVVGDYRRSLLEAVPSSHLLEYAPTASALQMHMEALNGLVARRQPPDNVTPQQLRDRSWWTGSQVFIVIDDYELVSTQAGNPLSAMVDDLPFARDVGVRFIIARSTAGASRAMYESFMQRIKELGAQGVVLSGDPNEGEILGDVRARPMPQGRGYLVTRKRGTPLVQLAWMPDLR